MAIIISIILLLSSISVLLLPAISVPSLPVFELFLFSHHDVDAAATAAPTAPDDDDDDDVDDDVDEYDLPSTAHSLLHSEINCCCIN